MSSSISPGAATPPSVTPLTVHSAASAVGRASAATGGARLTAAQQARAAHISPLRLGPFLRATGHDTGRALVLYEWNVATSAAIYEVLHRFEVGLRNAMDPRLCAWNSTQMSPTTGARHGSDWLIDPCALLQQLAKKTIDDATPRAEKAVRRGNVPRAMLHDDVLAATSLGTWRFLLPDKSPRRQRLWADALCAAFPHLPAGESEFTVTKHVREALDLRNRVAHLEPLLDVRKAMRQIDGAYTVAGWIDPHLRDWLTSTSRTREAFKARLAI